MLGLVGATAIPLTYSITALAEYFDVKKRDEGEAYRKIWFFNTGETERAKLRRELIIGAIELFISYEYPCNKVGPNYMYQIAFDGVRRVLDFLTEKSNLKDLPENPEIKELITKGVIYGKSKIDGVLPRLTTRKRGLDVENGKYTTKMIFENPGAVINNSKVVSNSGEMTDSLGYRLMLPFEEGFNDLLAPEKPKVKFGFPRIRNWKTPGLEEFIARISDSVVKILPLNSRDMVARIEKSLVSALDNQTMVLLTESENNTQRVEGVVGERREYVVMELSKKIDSISMRG